VEPIDRRKGKIQFSIENEIETAVKRIGAKHIIIDPVTSILIHESRSGKKRFLIGQLFDTIRSLGCSALITSEGLPSENDFYMELFLSDGVILLGKDIIDYKMIKITEPLNVISDLTELKSLIEGYLENNEKNIAVSFTDASYLYSGAISVLISCYRMVQGEGGHLCIVEPNKELSDLLNQMNIDSIIDIYTSEVGLLDTGPGGSTPA